MQLFSNRGIPASIRHLNAYSGHTYKLTTDVCFASFETPNPSVKLTPFIDWLRLYQNSFQNGPGHQESISSGSE